MSAAAAVLVGLVVLVVGVPAGAEARTRDPARGGARKCGRVLIATALRDARGEAQRRTIPPGCTEAFIPPPYEVRPGARGAHEVWRAGRRLLVLEMPPPAAAAAVAEPAAPVLAPASGRSVFERELEDEHEERAAAWRVTPVGFPPQTRRFVGQMLVVALTTEGE